MLIDLLQVEGAVDAGTLYQKWRAPIASQQERADETVYYPTGMGANAPTIAAGVLTLKQLNAAGLTTKTHLIPYASIVKGSVFERAYVAASKKKISMRIKGETEVDRIGGYGLTLKPHMSRLNGYEPWSTQIVFSVDITEGLTTDQRLTKLRDTINVNTSSPAVATVDLANDLLILEAKEAGIDFEVATEGFYPEDILAPSREAAFTLGDFYAAGLPQSVLVNRSLQLKALVFKTRDFKAKGGVGVGTSSMNTDNREYEVYVRTWIVLFDGADTNSNAAYTALKGILTMSTATTVANLKDYIAAAASTLAADNTTTSYFYTVERADTVGGTTQQNQAATDYASAGTVTFKGNDGTKSYYEIKSTSPTKPTASGSDTVIEGKTGKDDTDPIA